MTALALIVFTACEHITERPFRGNALVGSMIALLATLVTDVAVMSRLLR